MSGRAYEYLASVPLCVTPEALEAGIAIATREALRPESVEARKARPVDGAKAMGRRDGVCVIPIQGPIFRYADFFVDLCGGATVEDLARDLRLALDDPTCRAILLAVDSPGGEASGIAELAGMIREADATKPVVAYVGHQGCSAAYWLAAAAREVVVASTAMVGSIGVVMGYPRKSEGGRSVEFVSSQSPNKRPDVATEAGRAEVQRVVDDLAEEFVGAVAAYRGVSPETVLSDFGKGGMLVGKKAVAAGMADRVGTFEGTLSELARGAVPRRAHATQAAAAGASDPEVTPMFQFLFKQKADGTMSVEPVATAPAASETAQAGAGTPVATPVATPADASAKDGEIATLRLQLAQQKLETIKAQAVGWYDALFAANKIVPAEKDHAIGAYVQAAFDDLRSPVAAGSAPRVSLLDGIYKARTAHTLTQEQAGEGALDPAAAAAVASRAGGRVLDHKAGDPNAAPTAARVNQLIGHLIAAGQVGENALAAAK